MGDVPKLLLTLLNTVQRFVGLQCTKVGWSFVFIAILVTILARSYRHLSILQIWDQESLQDVLMAVLEVNLSRVL